MPDMSLEAVHAFWHDYDKRTLYRIVTSMEGIESWAADDEPEVEELLLRIGSTLDEISDFELTDEASLIKVLANLRSGRALRLMQFLDVLKPGTASKLLIYAEEQTKDAANKNRYADLFLKRNLAFERLQLLGRVFAPERINLILKALESNHE
ncbi:type IVB secretion system protein IcmW [Candidatus Berkiella aquae]|uniref:Type IVB secretion system protein IcmW n=1 Tax=Candidatus Berkiella aquae TaxID=295108 RepID=A0A0Q9YWW0_9GAMM|nr:type IVB secretion system protein IcmW [Candidatus Berkiella aquae]MCS5711142.1 type IVB secretion system protein IcmW [Candidatus Berkiella aquae]